MTGQNYGDPAQANEVLQRYLRSGKQEFEFEKDGDTFIARVTRFEADDPTSPGLISIKDLDAVVAAPISEMQNKIGYGGVVLGLLGAALAYGVVYLVIRKITWLQSATLRIRRGDFETRVHIPGKDELAALGHAFNDMVTGLQALGLYTDPSLARSVLEKRSSTAGDVSIRVAGSIFFSDLSDFTGIAERLSPEALTAQLNEYFEVVAQHIEEQGGYLDKFIGDSVMAFFGPPFIGERDFALRACRTALGCASALQALRDRWQAEQRPQLHQRIGIVTGEVILGNVGSSTKKNFTVMGDSVNLASRLEGENKGYGTEILIDERTLAACGDAVTARAIAEVTVRGRQQPVRIFELLSARSAAPLSAARECASAPEPPRRS
ncbi:MAG: adenylate/guanylate cyclase domain-containing protein [Planctomycetota bacterium]